MTRRPLIGITTSEVRRDASGSGEQRTGGPRNPELALALPYVHAVERAGGLPVVLAPLEDPEGAAQAARRMDGLCLAGGPDIDPARYGRTAHPQLGPTEPAADAAEIAVVGAAVACGIPLLALCRGMQVVNVALGGTLHQHLPDLGTAVSHRQDAAGTTPSHDITTAPGSRLREILGMAEVTAVNSFHHQAIDVLGDDLVSSAWAPDGVIEAVEGAGFLLGVQWHAETLTHLPEQARLFQALVGAAAERMTVHA